MNIKEAQEQLQQLADELKAELGAPEEWPRKGDLYWTIDTVDGVTSRHCKDTPLFMFRKSIGWIWRTEAEAKKHFNVLQATERVRSYIAKANKDADWVANFKDDGQQKATWQYSHQVGRFQRITNQFIQKSEAWRYIKPELFVQLIEGCGDDILLIMGVG